MLDYTPESFSAQNSFAMLCLLPYLQQYGIDKLIRNSDYPETSTINRLSSILCFVALKLSNVRRYSADDIWCIDRGLGLFAGLNVLPKIGFLCNSLFNPIPLLFFSPEIRSIGHPGKPQHLIDRSLSQAGNGYNLRLGDNSILCLEIGFFINEHVFITGPAFQF